MIPILKQTAKQLPYIRRLVSARDRLEAATNLLGTERDRIQAERDRVLAEKNELHADRDQILAEKNGLLAERDQLAAVINQLRAESDAIRNECNHVLNEKQRLHAERDGFEVAVHHLRAERDRVLAERNGLQAERDQAVVERDGYRKACYVPPGHCYSPIPDVAELRRREKLIWGARPESLPAIDLNTEGQLALVAELERYYSDQPFARTKQPHLRYWFENNWFGFGDSIFLHCLIRHLRPQRILEIGSGFSSAAILDTNDFFFNSSIHCTFIEPNPQRLLSLLSTEDQRRYRIITTPLQDLGLLPFRELGAGDILFIDTSHVIQTGGEVNRILFEILPALQRGVFIHIHDIFYPFEYPKEWALNGWAWNECYALRAFLQYNNAFKIRLFNSYLVHQFAERFRREMPLCVEDPGGSIWLEKVAD